MVTDIWAEFLTIVRQEEGSRIVETWFKAVNLVRWDIHTSTVFLRAPNPFVRDWVKTHYITLIQKQLARLLSVAAVSVIFTDTPLPTEELKPDAPVCTHNDPPLALIPAKKVAVDHLRQKKFINRQHLFETFVVGSHNSLAYAAACAVAEKPGQIYNPLFLYGSSGLGKTHLLHAIGNALKNQDRRYSIVYQPADRFVHEFISAIRYDEVAKFQAKYKTADILLIDDIQFMSNKDQTQEAFFHIFNTLYDANKQIVFSSDTFPHHLKGIADRLKSRLACGLVADLHAPTLETKIAIVKKKADLSNEVISDEVAYFIAQSVDSNIRELEGALIRVLASAALTHQPVTVELAQQVLKFTSKGGSSKVLDAQAIISYIENRYSLASGQLQSKARSKDISHARHIAMYLLKKMTDRSLRDIGIIFGGRDHSTVLHAIDRVEEHKKTTPTLANEIKIIEQELMNV